VLATRGIPPKVIAYVATMVSARISLRYHYLIRIKVYNCLLELQSGTSKQISMQEEKFKDKYTEFAEAVDTVLEDANSETFLAMLVQWEGTK
jgi:Domain of unknown function (DUF6532)